ncbi:hypothetical protein [Snodgrassella alvi]|uniref:Type IV secretion protein Rhs n=1 Tax=Snodgrassella alvi TaxID=1196083 RepID=A0A2N9XY66_9NEIS|nr:hypothetical protein [Snodgrassella alvi]PIT55234.1 hypothetical protein BHC49_06730 [Snodgrassella alvi]
MTTKKGESRLLTPGEITMVTSLFKTAITVTSVRVYNDTCLPFQSKFGYAVTPRGAIYWPEGKFKEDYSIEIIRYMHWFMHEMTHVWQYQMGMCVICRGLISFAVEYEYDLENGNLLSEYGMEQQASIIADYYILNRFGFDAWHGLTKHKYKGHNFNNKQLGKDFWLKIYQKTLHLFLKNPKDNKALFK